MAKLKIKGIVTAIGVVLIGIGTLNNLYSLIFIGTGISVIGALMIVMGFK